MKHSTPRTKSLKVDIQKLDRYEIRKAIVLKEILGPPKALEPKG